MRTNSASAAGSAPVASSMKYCRLLISAPSVKSFLVAQPNERVTNADWVTSLPRYW